MNIQIITKILPVAMIVMSVFASVVYFVAGDIRKGIYWMSAAILNAAVTF